MIQRRRFLTRSALLATAPWATVPALAQDTTLRIVVGYPPGGASDRVGRIVADKPRQTAFHAPCVQGKG